jgi:hypothetical protein
VEEVGEKEEVSLSCLRGYLLCVRALRLLNEKSI